MTVVQRGLFDGLPEPSVLPAVTPKEPGVVDTTVQTVEPRVEPHNEPERSSWEATIADYLSWRY
jgi:hypothetical protein